MAKKYLDMSPGVRYVFYSCLLKEENPSLVTLGQHAQNILNKHSKELIHSKDSSTENEIDQVIKLLQIALKQEQEAELEFINQKIINNPNLLKYPKFVSNLKKSCSNPKKFSYLKVITALNLALKGVEDFKKNLALEISRVTQVQQNVNKLLKTENKTNSKKREEHYIRHGGAYDKKYAFLRNQVKETFAGHRSKMLKEVLEKVLNNHKQDFINLGYNMTEEEIMKLLQVPLAIEIMNNLDTKQIEANLQNILNKEYNNIFNTNKIARIKSFEVQREKETEKYSGRNLFNIFKELKDLGEEQAIKILDDYLEGNGKKGAESFQKMIEDLEEMRKDNASDASIAGKQGYFSSQIKYFLNQTGVYEKILQSLTKIQVTINRPSLSELIAGAQASINVPKLKVHIEGEQLLKNDFVITAGFPDELMTDIFNYIEKDFYQQVNEQEMLIREKEFVGQAKNTTSVKATTVLYDILLEANKIIKKKENDKLSAEILQKTLEELKKSFYIQGSAKDLETPDTNIGYIGGTLGSSWEVAIDNLLKMYEQGGISVIDKEWLLTAVLNTSSSSLGAHLKSPIERYLSFSAAMLMFGQGGTQIKLAGDELLRQVKVIHKPNIMNVYYLNSNYYPASIVLQIILNNLTEVYNSLTHLIGKANQNKTGVQIINNSYYGMLSEEGQKLSKVERWEKYGKETGEQMRIKFVFLAGILDIMKKVNSQLNNITNI